MVGESETEGPSLREFAGFRWAPKFGFPFHFVSVVIEEGEKPSRGHRQPPGRQANAAAAKISLLSVKIGWPTPLTGWRKDRRIQQSGQRVLQGPGVKQ